MESSETKLLQQAHRPHPLSGKSNEGKLDVCSKVLDLGLSSQIQDLWWGLDLGCEEDVPGQIKKMELNGSKPKQPHVSVAIMMQEEFSTQR